MSMRKNVLRELLNAGKPTISTRMVTIEPKIVEIIGLSGMFDFIEYLGEYGSWTLPDLENFARAVDLFPHMTAMMKIEREPRMFITHRALGAGIQNVNFADCDSADEVRECIRYVRPLSPQGGGLHGCGMRRNVGYVIESGTEAWVKAMKDVVIEVMIESREAEERLDEILSVEGIDMLHFGPCDYTLTVGMVGKKSGPEMKKKHKEIFEKAIKKGVRPRVIINSFEDAQEYLDIGVRDFCVGSDLGNLYRWCVSHGGKMRELLSR
jgi:2-keto-3-deoxy-L-rhamnonate aldolase RhmA